MYKFSKNTFNKGLNKDIDDRIVPADSYRNAINVTIVREGEILSLSTIGGSEVLSVFETKVTQNLVILGSYECNIEEGKGVVVFYKGEDIYGSKYNGIKLVDFKNDTVYQIADDLRLNFEDVDYVDGVIDNDNGEDVLRFIDGVNPPRLVKCLTSTVINNEKEICGLRYSPVDKIDLKSVDVGGVLLSGSYQIAYQYKNTETGVESTPSLFTNPLSIYPSVETDYDKIYGGVPNEQTNKKIELSIPINTSNKDINEIRALYNSVSLLVLKAVDGSKTMDSIVSVTTPSKSIYNNVLNGSSFDYLGSEQSTTTTIDQINVDDALIETARTITIKEGNLFLGNITYRDLEIKSDEGTLDEAYSVLKSLGKSGNILKPNSIIETPIEAGGTNSGGYLNPLNTANFKSEMRGEVLRYGLIYTDIYGGWSEPKAIDFSNFSAFDRVNNTLTSITNTTVVEVLGGTVVTVSSANNVDIGDFIETNKGEYHLVLNKEVNGGGFDLLLDSFLGGANPTGFYTLKGGKYNNAKSIDWKFPERKNTQFTLLDDSNQGSISALGLYLKGINNHPDWAVGLSIVRVSRDKNILTQAISLPCTTGNGSADLVGDDVQPASYANITGSFFAKPLSRGGNVNTTRWTPDNEGYSEPLRADSNSQKTGGRHDVLPLVKLLSPDYMFSNVANTEIYNSSWFGVGYKLDLVDAISTLRTDAIEFNTDIDDGDNKGDQQAFSFRADGKFNYYYQKNEFSRNLGSVYDPISTRRLYNSNNTIKGYYPAVNGIAPIALPTSLLPDNATIRNIVLLGDLKGVSGYNTSNEQAELGGIDPKEQKGVYVVLDEVFGDVSYYAAQSGQSSSGEDYYKDYLLFSRSGITEPFYNIDEEKLKYTGVDNNTEWNNLINKISESSLGVLGITNVVKGLGDDRYGNIDKSHIFLPTGTYIPLYDNTESVDTSVFGGDTFISKPTFKVNESILGAFRVGEGDENINNKTAIRAYSDWIELVSCYIESDVNSQLQADPYIYPIENKGTPTEFKTDYDYPYHFGYSAKNLSKVFINKEGVEDVVNYTSRIIFSDKHIINSTDGNYSRFRVSSLYDLDGSYGNITKLLKAYDDNIYCLQENGFSLVPIGKKTIEDGSGGEIVINTSDTITTPKYFLNNNGCQNIESVKSSKDSFYWADRDRREIFMYKGGVNRISDKGMYSFFNQELDRYTGRLDGVFDMDREEYILTIGSKSVVFSSKLAAWVSLFDLEGFNSFISGEDRLFIVGENGFNINIEEMYVTEEQCNILGSYNDSEISVVFNDGGTIPKTFDVVRVDSTAHIDECEMSVRTLNDGVMNTGVFAIENRGRQGGYEYPSIRDIDTGQRLRGKSCILTLRTKNDVDTKNVSINSVMLKYRESPNAFIKRYRQTK